MNATYSFTLFSDFNCPFCYALHERLYGLQLIERCTWQGVQHAPHLAIPLKPWKDSLGAELRHEVSVVNRLSPDLPLHVPLGKPNTANAIACAAELLMRDREAGMTLVRRIYQAFWVEGQDISSPVELARLGGDMIAPQSNSDGKATSRRWAAAWEATGQAGVPLIVAPGGDVLIGCVSTEEIEQFFTDHG